MTGLANFKAFEADAASRWLSPPEATRLGVNVVESCGFERTYAAV